MCQPENDSGPSTDVAERRPSLKIGNCPLILEQSRYRISFETTGQVFFKLV